MNATTTCVIRPATPADAAAMAWLAERDSQAPLHGPALLAEIEGRPAAALSLVDGRALGDPFRPTERLIGFLRDCAADGRRPQEPRRSLRTYLRRTVPARRRRLAPAV